METSHEASQKKTESLTSAPPGDMEDGLQHNYEYEVMQSVSPKGSSDSGHLERPDSPYLVLKEPSPSALGGTVNLILSFSNSGDTQIEVQAPGMEDGVPVSEPVHRVRMIKHHNHTQSNPIALKCCSVLEIPLRLLTFPSLSSKTRFSVLFCSTFLFSLLSLTLLPVKAFGSAARGFLVV